MRHIMSWSGGKDSTASIILAHIHNEPLDEILFAEVMYDNERGISGEHPRHIHFINEVAIPLFESWGYKVTVLRSEMDYLTHFNHVITKNSEKNKGKRYGFCMSGICSIKRECKMRPINDYYKAHFNEEEVMQYVGIAIDEPKRLESLHKDPTRISLLEKYCITEAGAKALCEQHGLLSPAYELSNRGGCFFCENAKCAEHKAMRKENPDLWYEFIALENEENLAYSRWKSYGGETLHDREERFKREDLQLSLFDDWVAEYFNIAI